MAFPRRRRRFDLAVLHRRRGKADRQKHETEKGKAPFHVAATIFVVRGKGEDRDGGHDRGHRFGVVRAKAQKAFAGGAGAHQFDQAEMLPALRRDVRKRRVQGIGVRSFECCECGKKFTALTGTIFDSKKIPISEWIEFLLHLFEFHSLKTSASDNRNAETTGRYWLSKVFAVLRGIQDGVVLSGRVWIDEKLFDAPKSEKESAKRKSNAKGGLARGCQYYVACGTDGERSFYVVTGKSKPGDKAMLKAYGKRIAECSTLVHDGEKGHNAVIDALALKSEVHTSAETRGTKDEDNPLDEINDLHDKMEKFMRAHSGYD